MLTAPSPIVSGAVDNAFAIPNALDTSRRLWFTQMAFRAVSSMWCVRFVGALITDVPGASGSRLVRPFRRPACLGRLEPCQVSLLDFFASSVCALVLTCLTASSAASQRPRRSLTLPTCPRRLPGRLARLEPSLVSLLDGFFPSVRARVLTCLAASAAASSCLRRVLGLPTPPLASGALDVTARCCSSLPFELDARGLGSLLREVVRWLWWFR
jgi:hypothetical protein